MPVPNIIFLFPDQLGANHLGCYGNEVVSTPHIDRFAEQNLLFEAAYTASPVCTPYRGALLTGLYPSVTGVTENGMLLPRDIRPTLAHTLKSVGYRTAYLGKWHLSGEPQANRWVPPEDRGGFEDFVGWESHHVDHWAGRIWGDDPAATAPAPLELEMPGHETDALAGMAEAKLRELAREMRPFCLFVAFQAPHPPCRPPQEYRDLYRQSLPARENVPSPAPDYNKPGWNAQYSNDEFLRRYWAEVSHLDAAVGRILATVDELGLFDSSVVVFTSDHGELAGSHGEYGKFVMYEESVAVPLIVSMPRERARRNSQTPAAGSSSSAGNAATGAAGAAGPADAAAGSSSSAAGPSAGVRSRDLFSTVDFYPTFAELCGGSAPNVPAGVSFADRWRELAARGKGVERTPGPRSVVYMEYKDRAVTDGRFKLIVGPSGTMELYDLTEDPFEMCNLLEDSPDDAKPVSPAPERARDRLLAELRDIEQELESARTAAGRET